MPLNPLLRIRTTRNKLLLLVGVSFFWMAALQAQHIALAAPLRADTVADKILPLPVTPLHAAKNTLLQAVKNQPSFAGMGDTVMGNFLQYVQTNFGAARVNNIVGGFAAAKDSAALEKFITGKLKGFYAVKGPEAFNIPAFDPFFNHAFRGAGYQVSRQNNTGAPSPWMHQVQVADQVTVMNIPFNIEFANLVDGPVPLQYNNLLKTAFSKEGFEQGLQKKLGRYYDMQKYLSDEGEMLGYVKKHFDSELAGKIKNIRSDYLTDPQAFLQSKISPDELLKLDMDQVREKVMPAEQLQQTKDQWKGWEQTLAQQGEAMPAAQKDSLLQLMKGQAQHLAAVEQLLAGIEKTKKEMAGSGINANQVTRMQQAVTAGATQKLQQPGTIRASAENLLPMNGLQRFFMRVTSLQAGTFGQQGSQGGVNGLLSGLQLSALKKNNSFGGGFGKMKDGGYLKDAGLQNSLVSPTAFMQFLQFGKSNTPANSTRISMLNSNTVAGNSPAYSSLSLPRNTFVGTFSKTIPVRKAGTVEAEISKSANQYRNTVAPDADRVMQSKSALLNYGEDFWQTLSVGVRYTDEWEQLGLSNNVHIGYAGFGYNNPGNPAASKGAFQYDVQLRKQLPDRKGFVQAQFASRNYNYSADGGQRWKNLQVNLQGRYRFSKAFQLGGRLNQYQLIRKQPWGSEKMYVSRKVMADAQLSGNIAGIAQRSVFSLGWQQFDNVYIQQGSNSNLLLVQWAGTIPAGKIVWQVNCFYNKEISDQQLIGDLLTGEAGASYTVLKNIQLTSSLTYLDNPVAARQAGIRQSVNTTLLKNCVVGLYIDCRKDLVAPANPYLYGNFRGEMSIHYLIK